MNDLILGILWILYYALHSALASGMIKRNILNSFPEVYRYFRTFYSFFAAVNFFLLLWLHSLSPSQQVFAVEVWIRITAIIFLIGGLIVCLCAGKSYGIGFLFRETNNSKLATTGINSLVRHPLYFGILMIVIGVFLYSPLLKNLVLLMVTFIYSIVGSYWEEKKLIELYGSEYLEYKRKVKMLIPWLL